MRRYNIFYFIKQAFAGIWRNGVMSFASIFVLMGCLVVIGGFSLLVLNIDENLDQFKLMNEIVVYVDTEASEEQIVAVGDKISALDNVESVKRVTKEEGLANMKNQYGSIYEDVTSENNPLPDMFIVTYINTERADDLYFQIWQIDDILKVNNHLELAKTLENAKSGIMLVFIGFLIVLTVVSVFIIVNTVKLSVFSRRSEISIMRYVGATAWFITLPFVFEGIIIGIFASIAAYFIEWYVYSYIEALVVTDFQMISILSFSSINTTVLLGFIAIGVLTGVIGSFISLVKYLKE